MISAKGLAMTTTIAAGGTITIPQELLEEAGLKPGTPVQVAYREGHIEIEALPRKIRFERRGSVTVGVPIEPVEEPLTNEQVNDIIEQIRQERMSEIIGEIPPGKN
jgi:bifunctional DNA-binding transcriptional regulator/antitoxin component of YhaV-PrlF toxin-antitoxin module